jgi:subtilase family serine protease
MRSSSVLRQRKGNEALAKRLRFVVWLPLVAALCAASAASAVPMRPALAPPTSFAPLSTLVRTSVDAFICPNGGLCYFPSAVQQAYNFPTGPNAPTGAGQTIVIVTAYGAPDIQYDLQSFDYFTGTADPPSFVIAKQQAVVPGAGGSGQSFFWQIETSLDVEYAHAMAPGARIVLAVAKTDDTKNIAQVLREVLPNYPGAIVSQSFGMDETGPASDPSLSATFSPMYLDILRKGGTVLAASGDFGASNGTELESFMFPELKITPSPMASYPASDPLVLSVGGTQGNPLASDSGAYGSEQAWNEIFGGQSAAGGGAASVIFDAPPWQRSLNTKDRLEPDVSYNAAANGGVFVVLSCPPDAFGGVDEQRCNPADPHYNAVGGTSAGAPQWAAIIALANELRARQVRGPLGLVSPVLYDLARNPRTYGRDFHDITSGNNALDLSVFGFPGSQFGFAAQPGYDLATGLGTPDVSNLLSDLSRHGSGEIPGNLLRSLKQDGKNHGPHRFDPSK